MPTSPKSIPVSAFYWVHSGSCANSAQKDRSIVGADEISPNFVDKSKSSSSSWLSNKRIYGTDTRTKGLYHNVHGRNFALCSNCWSLIIEKSSGVVRYTRIRITAPHRRGPVGTSSARDTFFSTNDLIMNGDRRKILVLLIDIFV